MPRTWINTLLKLKSGGGILNGVDGLYADGKYSLPVYESLTTGDLVKSLNDSGTFKAAKVVGIKNAVTQTVTKTGNLLKAKISGNGKIVLLTDTPKLYVASWDGTTMGALTDITPSAVTGLRDFDIDENNNVVYVRAIVGGSYVVYAYSAIITISGSPSFGGETSITVDSANWSSKSITTLSIVSLTNSSLAIHIGGYNGNGGMNYSTLYAGSVTGSTITFGSGVGISQGRPMQVADGILKKYDSTHTFLSLRWSDYSTYTRVFVTFATISGTIVTVNNYQIASTVSDGNDATHDAVILNNKIISFVNLAYEYNVQAETSLYSIGTVTGNSISFAATVALPAYYNYTLNRMFNITDSVYMFVSNTCYRWTLSSSGFYLLDTKVLSDYYFVAIDNNNVYKTLLSNDNAIKTTKFLLDTYDFIGIAKKSYVVSDNFPIATEYEKSGVVPGVSYYIGADGQSLVTTTTTKKVGRAITDTLIVKE